MASTVAVFSMRPASTSDWVTVYDAEHVMSSPGASIVWGHATAPPVRGSSTVIASNVAVPVLVTGERVVEGIARADARRVGLQRLDHGD